MSDRKTALTIAVLGIISAVAGAGGGAFFNYVFGRQAFIRAEKAKIEAEKRVERLEAYLEYLSSRDLSRSEREAKLLFATYRIVVFGDSDTIEKMATAYREQARKEAKAETNVYCAKETAESRNRVLNWIRVFQSLRKQYRLEDKVSDEDLASVLCPGLQPCFGEQYVSHLLECK